ncbi:MAG: hypothetical protein ACREQ5_01665 [Candidatus Dormibacteria bacterium]
MKLRNGKLDTEALPASPSTEAMRGVRRRNTRRIELALWMLGDTPTAIAASLMKLGIQGVRNFGCSCPIAMYLERVFDDAKPFVSSVGAEVGYGAAIPTPQIRDFIKEFDSGAYPELIAD